MNLDGIETTVSVEEMNTIYKECGHTVSMLDTAQRQIVYRHGEYFGLPAKYNQLCVILGLTKQHYDYEMLAAILGVK